MVFLAKFWSAEGGEAECFGNVVEKWEGNKASSHLTGNSNETFGVGALVEGPHGSSNGRIDVLAVTYSTNAEPKKSQNVVFLY